MTNTSVAKKKGVFHRRKSKKKKTICQITFSFAFSPYLFVVVERVSLQYEIAVLCQCRGQWWDKYISATRAHENKYKLTLSKTTSHTCPSF